MRLTSDSNALMKNFHKYCNDINILKYVWHGQVSTKEMSHLSHAQEWQEAWTGNYSFRSQSCISHGIRAVTITEEEAGPPGPGNLHAHFWKAKWTEALLCGSFTGFLTCSIHFPIICARSLPSHCRSLSASLICMISFVDTWLGKPFKIFISCSFFYQQKIWTPFLSQNTLFFSTKWPV